MHAYTNMSLHFMLALFLALYRTCLLTPEHNREGTGLVFHVRYNPLTQERRPGSANDGWLVDSSREAEGPQGCEHPTETHLIPRSYFVNKQQPVALN